MKLIHLLTAVILTLSVAACSDKPTEAKLENILQQQVDERYNGLISVDDVKKLNGWQDNDKHYAAEVSYTITFKQSFKDYIDAQTTKPGNPLEKMANGMSAGMLKLQYGDFKAGDHYQVAKEIITLRKSENGWILDN